MEQTYTNLDGAQKDWGSRTFAASVAKPYKLDREYGFGLVSGAVGTTYGKLVDANTHELVFEVRVGDKLNLVIVGRCAITCAIEVETANTELEVSRLIGETWNTTSSA